VADRSPNRDIQVLKTYGAAPYAAAIKKLEKQIKEKQASVNEKIGVKVWRFLLPKVVGAR
jgi:hypothetical protein